MDLSDLLRKLAGPSSERQGRRKVAGSHPRGEQLARLTRSHGLDITRLSKSIGESPKMGADVDLEGYSSGGFSTTEGSREGNRPVLAATLGKGGRRSRGRGARRQS